jgi:hypothetical protein
MNNKTKKRITPILEMYGIEKQNLTDFLNACPYPLETLQKDVRRVEITDWRHLGALFATIEKGSVSKGATIFKKHHATLLNSFKILEYGYPEFYENMELINEECKKRLYNESIDQNILNDKIQQIEKDVQYLKNKAAEIGLEVTELNFELKK